MGLVKDLFQVINGKMPSYNSAFLRSRGVTIPLDIFLTGYIRFARKIGGIMPIWLPDVSTTIARSLTVREKEVILNRNISWIEPGDKVRIGRSILEVDDILDNNKIVLVSEPQTNYPSGTDFELYSTSLEIVGTYLGSVDSRVTNFVVRSRYRMFNGDQINWKSTEFDITNISETGVEPDGRITYLISIDSGIPETLNNQSSNQVYLRAYPAYESQTFNIPRVLRVSISDIGPFLFDRFSGSTFNDLEVIEYDTIRLHRPDNSIFSERYPSSKNQLILNKSISADTFLFYDVQRGSINYNNTTQEFRATTNNNGLFHTHYHCVPVLDPGQIGGWNSRVRAEVPTRIIIELEPMGRYVFNIPGGNVETTINIPFPNDAIERIHVMADSRTLSPLDYESKQVHFGSWNIIGTEVDLISHTTVARVNGEFTWGSTGMFVKPNFMLLDYIRASADLFSRFDGGLIVT